MFKRMFLGFLLGVVFVFFMVLGVARHHIQVTNELGEGLSWAYKGEKGPERWHLFSPANALCSDGKLQSPINLPMIPQMPRIREPYQFEFHYQPTPLIIGQIGHTVRIVEDNASSYVLIGGHRYDFKQLHFHVPSEHALADKKFPMEVHLVHVDNQNNIVQIAIFLNHGQENPLIKQLWQYFPTSFGPPLAQEKVTIDPALILPKNKSGYLYMGSRATPPCTEGVMWVVLTEPVSISIEQLGRFSEQFSENVRPLQRMNNRTLYWLMDQNRFLM